MKNKKPSAQAQVKNKVNAGIMDGICYGPMEEGKPDFEIGYENNSPLEYAHVVNGSAGINEEKKNDDLVKRCKEIAKFMNDNGLKVSPLPILNFDDTEQDGLFIKTGYYQPDEKRVVVFTKDRHPKDILRSFAHEMVHHAQNLRGENLGFSSNDDVKDNEELEKLESEAYLKGNIYFRKWTEYVHKDNGVLNESKFAEALEPDDVDLSSFNIKKRLNPKFWVDGHLDSRVRIKLLDIADDFIEELNIPWVEIKDVIITGSLANYNWNKEFSDIDLHVVVDYSDVDDNTDLVDEYFYAKKKNWNDEHKDISIYGFPVEVYVQDAEENHNSTGVYSLEKDKWITEPDKENFRNPHINSKKIRKRVSHYTKAIDKLEEEFYNTEDFGTNLESLDAIVGELWDRIRKERSDAMAKGNAEISNGNLIFKSLRRNGYLAKLSDLKTKIYDKMCSLNEANKRNA